MLIVTGEKENRTKHSQVSVEKLVDDTVQQVSDNLNPDEHSRNTWAGETLMTELTQLFLNIQSCITHLFELSVLIRRDRPRGRVRPTGLDKWDFDSGPDVTNVKDKFPKLKESPWLAQRMGNWIAQQREYIRYRQKHRQKLAKSRVTIGVDGTSMVLSGQVTTKATSYHEQQGMEIILDDTRTTESIRSSATSFATTAPTDIGAGRRIPQLTDMWLDGVQLGYDIHIECPYCRTIQKFKDRYQWK
jgi:hypothetical protein